jgi:ribonuclease HI
MYTDGACSPNPGKGGWGVVVIGPQGMVHKEMSGCDQDTTNNRMELTAALRGLQGLKEPHRVTLITDSSYVKNGITSWIHGWRRRSWLTADRQPVKNRDLWELLDREINRHQVTWQWVRGHALDQWNERADTLAVAARKEIAVDNSDGPVAGPDENRIAIFSGITYAPSRRQGAWAVILSYQRYIKVMGGAAGGGSANQFHLTAAIAGLSALKKELPVILYTTSGYLRDGLEGWLIGWQKRGWTTREGKPVSNRKLWQQLAALAGRYRVEVRVVSRKNGFCLLQEAKELAREWTAENISRYPQVPDAD